MDHLNLNPTGTTGIVNSGQTTPPPNTPAPYNATFTGAIDGSDPATASKNMAWIYNMLSSEVRNVLIAAGVTPDKDNWAQLAQSITAIAQTAAAGVTPPNAFQAASEAAMLAANAKDNDICVRTDTTPPNQWFVCLQLPSNVIGNWAALPVQQAIQFATNAEVAAGVATNKAIAPDTAYANFLSKVDTAAQTMAGRVEFIEQTTGQGGTSTPVDQTRYGLFKQNIQYFTLPDFRDIPRLSGKYLVDGQYTNINLPTVSPMGQPALFMVDVCAAGSTGLSMVAVPITGDPAYIGKYYITTQHYFNGTWSAWQSLSTPTRTYHDETANRAAGVTYTNPYSYEIYIYIIHSGARTLTVGSSPPMSSPANNFGFGRMFFPIPPNASYTLSGTGAAGNWQEYY